MKNIIFKQENKKVPLLIGYTHIQGAPIKTQGPTWDYVDRKH